MNYGLPWKGSKNRLVKEIIPEIQKRAQCPETGQHFYDIFGGGGAVSSYILHHHLPYILHYNELEPWVYWAYKDALDGKFKNEHRWISRDDFNAIKAWNYDPENMTEEDRILYAYTLICFSFGNNGKGYLYGEKIEPFKHALHIAIYDRDYSEALKYGFDLSPIDQYPTPKERRIAIRNVVFNHYCDLGVVERRAGHYYIPEKNTPWVDRSVEDCYGLDRSENMERELKLDVSAEDDYILDEAWELDLNRQAQSLDTIENITTGENIETIYQEQAAIQQEKITYGQTSSPIIMTNLSYEDVKLEPNSIIYCDPPYKGTDKYFSDFDYDRFYDWCEDRAKDGHKVFVSEYYMPEDRFTSVWSKSVLPKLAGGKAKTRKTEKLWMVKTSISEA